MHGTFFVEQSILFEPYSTSSQNDLSLKTNYLKFHTDKKLKTFAQQLVLRIGSMLEFCVFIWNFLGQDHPLPRLTYPSVLRTSQNCLRQFPPRLKNTMATALLWGIKLLARGYPSMQITEITINYDNRQINGKIKIKGENWRNMVGAGSRGGGSREQGGRELGARGEGAGRQYPPCPPPHRSVIWFLWFHYMVWGSSWHEIIWRSPDIDN